MDTLGFETISLPARTEEDHSMLNAPFTSEEVWTVIRDMPSSKSPGLDGYPLEFYRTFWPSISPMFMPVLNDVFSGQLPDTWKPISLLNVDYKIITKILSRGLENLLPKIINPDQTSFVKNRFGSDNLHRLFNILYQATSSKDPTLLVSLDAEKTFDQVEWSFLFSTLEKCKSH
uniref:Reverse transcriptase domain-containing protein n=1 Tax=Denticeps clupeoides TaxID=299321 RepID=A0AAY3ZW41_9TELE